MWSTADGAEWWQRSRFVVNGVFATAVHFGVLIGAMEGGGWESAGLANLFAACCGIVVSFAGNRCFVFRAQGGAVRDQAWRFLALYGAIALGHGVVLWAWTDLAGLDYRFGFLMATVGQVVLSYVGNKRLVFK